MRTLDDVTNFSALLESANKCERGVRWKASVQMFEIDKLRWLTRLQKDVNSGNYKGMGFRRFDIVERGKLRHIQSVHISERTIQKSLCNNAIRLEVNPRLIYDNSASQKGKGTEFALKRLKKHLRWHYARYGTKGGILIIDNHDFFASIRHDIAIQELSKHFDDEGLKHYISYFIDAFDGDKGLGLGSEISQISAIFYLNDMDKVIKEQLGIHGYARYMDDSYVISDDIETLHRIKEFIAEESRKYGIELNTKKTKIAKFKNGDFEYLKKNIRLSETGKVTMRILPKNVRRERRKIRAQRAEYDAKRISKESIWQSYQSWRGYAKKYDNYKVIGETDKYFNKIMKGVDFSAFRKPKRNNAKKS